MSVLSIISLLSGLAFFLFGMALMGEALKKAAGNKLELILGRLAPTHLKGVLLGTFVTAIIQSSSATSIMVVSFVSSGIMGLGQAISVIMGANIGTTATGWLLTLADMGGGGGISKYFSTTVIFGVVAIIGIALYIGCKSSGKKNLGVILLALSVLMSGMKAMSAAMTPLQESEVFMSALTAVSNPFICIILGIAVTALVQSCSASIGILQALSMNGVIPYSIAIPTVVGMSIGACVPVLISAVGASKNGRRTALSYLYFNLIGGGIFMACYFIVSSTASGGAFLSNITNSMGIAVVNSVFKVFSVVILFPFINQLEKLVRLTVRDSRGEAQVNMLDDRLLDYPALAIEQGQKIIMTMAELAQSNLSTSIELFSKFDKKKYERLMRDEDEVDSCEDKLSAFVVKLTSKPLTFYETRQTAKFLHCMTDIERMSDHASNMAELAEKLNSQGLSFSKQAAAEISICFDAVCEIVDMTKTALINDDLVLARRVEPLEEIIDALTEDLKQRHINRIQKNVCSLEISFIFNDCINNLERVADHCSNIAISVIELHNDAPIEAHDYLRSLKQGDSQQFKEYKSEYQTKYSNRLKGLEQSF